MLQEQFRKLIEKRTLRRMEEQVLRKVRSSKEIGRDTIVAKSFEKIFRIILK
jgi:hypothetical protein